MKKAKRRKDKINPGDKVILCGMRRQGESPWDIQEVCNEIQGWIEDDLQAEVIWKCLDADPDTEEKQVSSMMAVQREHNAHLIMFGADGDFLFFPFGYCMKSKWLENLTKE